MALPEAGSARVHGGLDPEELERLGVQAAEVIDFSVNVNPYGPAPEMVAAVREAPLARYPDPRALAARRALARRSGVSPDRLALGNGGAELLWTLARVLIARGETALVLEPTFSEFRAAVAAAGGAVVSWPPRPGVEPVFDAAAIARAARDVQARAVYLCNPNNPTGRVLPVGALRALAESLPAVTLVLDEAFLSLSTRWSEATESLPENVVRVRSLTKEHAIPGLRVGYAIASAEVIARLEAARPAWTTSAGAQAAAIASTALERFVAESRDRLLADLRALATDLGARGLRPLPTDTIFLLLDVGDARRFREDLLRNHHILVRDCASFGLPAFVRLAARPAPDRQRLLAAVDASS